MTKPLSSLGKNTSDALIKYQPTRALVQSIEGTPLALPGTRHARRDPPGGGRSRHYLPPAVTPYGHFGMTLAQKMARNMVTHHGVGGGEFLPVPLTRAQRFDGVRT